MNQFCLLRARLASGHGVTARALARAAILALALASPAQAIVRATYVERAVTRPDTDGTPRRHPDSSNSGRGFVFIAILGWITFGGGDLPESPNPRTQRFETVIRRFRRDRIDLGANGLREVAYLVDRAHEFPLSLLVSGGSTLGEKGRFDAARREAHSSRETSVIPDDPVFEVHGVEELLVSLSEDIEGRMMLSTLLLGFAKAVRGPFVPSSTSTARGAKRDVRTALKLMLDRETAQRRMNLRRQGLSGDQVGRPLGRGEQRILNGMLRNLAATDVLFGGPGGLGVDAESLLNSTRLSQEVLDELLRDRRGPLSYVLVASLALQLYPHRPGSFSDAVGERFDLN